MSCGSGDGDCCEPGDQHPAWPTFLESVQLASADQRLALLELLGGLGLPHNPGSAQNRPYFVLPTSVGECTGAHHRLREGLHSESCTASATYYLDLDHALLIFSRLRVLPILAVCPVRRSEATEAFQGQHRQWHPLKNSVDTNAFSPWQAAGHTSTRHPR